MSTSSFRYCPFYCEENVWHLSADPQVPGADRRVVFVSNPARQVVLWAQRAASQPDEPVVWDYHVVLLCDVENTWRVWDLDSTLGLGVLLDEWARASFEVLPMPRELRPMFRCIEADAFRRSFASDRSHMRRPDGTYASPPPPWPRIGQGNNLHRFIDMRDEAVAGDVLDLEGLRRRFG